MFDQSHEFLAWSTVKKEAQKAKKQAAKGTAGAGEEEEEGEEGDAGDLSEVMTFWARQTIIDAGIRHVEVQGQATQLIIPPAGWRSGTEGMKSSPVVILF